MKGEKGDKTNKAVERLYELSLRDDFQNEIRVMRLKYGIPKNGFDNRSQRTRWNERADAVAFWELMLRTMDRYKVPTAYLVPFQEYVEFNKIETKTKQLDYVGFIDRYAHRKDTDQVNIEDWYIEKGEPFVKLILLGKTSKQAVHDFIDKNWETIKTVLAEQGDNPRERVRQKQYKERDAGIIKLSKKSNQELRIILGSHTKERNLKENLIRLIIHKTEYGGYVVSEGYIKKINNKYKERKNN